MNQDKLSKIISNYKYSEDDMVAVVKAGIVILPCLKEFSSKLHEYIFTFEHARAFLNTPDQLDHHKLKLEYWLTQVLSGVYSEKFFDYLEHINFVHKRIGLPSNYINSTFTFIRRFVRNKLNESGMAEYVDAVEKVLDLNLELLSTQYVNEDFDRTLLIIRILREAVDRGYIEPYTQQIVSADSLDVVSYECLCRINHPDAGLILPSAFLDVAKQIDMYREITKEMLQKCFCFFEKRHETFSVNLSFLDITDRITRKFINDILMEYKPGPRLIVEIVETEELDASDEVIGFIREMKEFDVQIAIDDFGSGFSNFNNIDKIKPDFIKIDGSLIRDIDTNSINYAAVESIVDMSHKLSIATVAEFVHSESVMEVCRRLGISRLQGFHIAKPVRLNEV